MLLPDIRHVSGTDFFVFQQDSLLPGTRATTLSISAEPHPNRCLPVSDLFLARLKLLLQNTLTLCTSKRDKSAVIARFNCSCMRNETADRRQFCFISVLFHDVRRAVINKFCCRCYNGLDLSEPDYLKQMPSHWA